MIRVTSTALLVLVVAIFSVSPTGLRASTALPGTAPEVTRAASAGPQKLDAPDLPAPDSDKERSDKRLRMRQVLLLWLLASQPSR